jgi:hypothetical protein
MRWIFVGFFFFVQLNHAYDVWRQNTSQSQTHARAFVGVLDRFPPAIGALARFDHHKVSPRFDTGIVLIHALCCVLSLCWAHNFVRFEENVDSEADESEAMVEELRELIPAYERAFTAGDLCSMDW